MKKLLLLYFIALLLGAILEDKENSKPIQEKAAVHQVKEEGQALSNSEQKPD